jgi:hypothetical protein
MEGFTFETALYLNMGYYHSKLDSDADDNADADADADADGQNLCTIVLQWHMENISTSAYPWISRFSGT